MDRLKFRWKIDDDDGLFRSQVKINERKRRLRDAARLLERDYVKYLKAYYCMYVVLYN